MRGVSKATPLTLLFLFVSSSSAATSKQRCLNPVATVSNSNPALQITKTNAMQRLQSPRRSSPRRAPVDPFLPTKNLVRRGADNRNACCRRHSSNVWRGLCDHRTGCLNPASSTKRERSTALASSTTCPAPVEPTQHARPNNNKQTLAASRGNYYASEWHPLHADAGKRCPEYLEQAAQEDAA